MTDTSIKILDICGNKNKKIWAKINIFLNFFYLFACPFKVQDPLRLNFFFQKLLISAFDANSSDTLSRQIELLCRIFCEK